MPASSLENWRLLLKEVLAECQKYESSISIDKLDEHRDVKLLSFLLLSRSINNIRGFLQLLEKDLPVEVGILARSCVENAIWQNALYVDSEKTIRMFDDDGMLNKRKRIEHLFALMDDTGEVPTEERKDSVKYVLREKRGLLLKNKYKRAKLEDLPGFEDVSELYHVFYAELSDGRAHISETSLALQADLIHAKHSETSNEILDKLEQFKVFYAATQSLLICLNTMLSIFNLVANEMFQQKINDLLERPMKDL